MSDYVRTINYYETDKMGVTHHSNYIRLMEEARIHYLAEIGCDYAKCEKDGMISPVIGIECKYKQSTTFNDEIRIHVEIVEYKGLKLTLSYTMYNTKNDVVVFVGKSRHCFVDEQGKPIALSRQFPEYDRMMKTERDKWRNE